MVVHWFNVGGLVNADFRKTGFPDAKIFIEKNYFFTKNIFSDNIAQALHNAVLVAHIDHWVMENDPSQVGRISENPGFCLKSRDPLDMDSMISQGKMSKLMENYDIEKFCGRDME